MVEENTQVKNDSKNYDGLHPMIPMFVEQNSSFDNILGNIFISSVWSSSQYDILEANQITHIQACGSELKYFFPDDICYNSLALNDFPQANLCSQLMSSFRFIESYIKSNLDKSGYPKTQKGGL